MFPRYLCLCAAVALTGVAASAQNVISAKSGLVHYTEGDVNVAGSPVTDKPGVFTDVKKNEQLDTTLGRAEVLLTPGVFLRVGEQSSVKMLNNALADTRVELVKGNAIVESDTPMKDNENMVVFKDYQTSFVKHGLFEFQSDPPQLKVYSGEAQVIAGGQTVTVKEGHLLSFTAALPQEHFDAKEGDSLFRWAKNRSEYISVANVSAARTAQYSPYGSAFSPVGLNTGLGSGFGSGLGYGNWFYNSFYGMYTYLPFNGIAYSPFGFAYFSPATVYQAYNYYGGGGYPSTSYLGSSTVRPGRTTSSVMPHSSMNVSGARMSSGGRMASTGRTSSSVAMPSSGISAGAARGGSGGGAHR